MYTLYKQSGTLDKLHLGQYMMQIHDVQQVHINLKMMVLHGNSVMQKESLYS